MQFHRWEKRWSYEKLEMKTKHIFGKPIVVIKKQVRGCSVVQAIFLVDATRISCDVVSNK